jgi:hypothetical protein
MSAQPAQIIICQKTKKNHIMSVVLTRPYIAATKRRKFG